MFLVTTMDIKMEANNISAAMTRSGAERVSLAVMKRDVFRILPSPPDAAG